MFLSQTGNSLEYFKYTKFRDGRCNVEADKNKAAEALGAYQVKKQGEYTLEDYYALPDDQRYELIDGVLYDMAAPAVTHQEVAFEIADVKNQKVIVYDLGDDFGENMLYC